MRFALSLITNTFPLLSLAFPTIPPPVLGFYVSTLTAYPFPNLSSLGKRKAPNLFFFL
jgi:hypothetical protein